MAHYDEDEEIDCRTHGIQMQNSKGECVKCAEAPAPPPVSPSNSSDLLCPPELIDLVRFLAETWAMTEDNRCKVAGMAPEDIKDFLIMQWPVVQGTRNQLNLKRIGEQPYKKENISKAVAWMLEA